MGFDFEVPVWKVDQKKKKIKKSDLLANLKTSESYLKKKKRRKKKILIKKPVEDKTSEITETQVPIENKAEEAPTLNDNNTLIKPKKKKIKKRRKSKNKYDDIHNHQVQNKNTKLLLPFQSNSNKNPSISKGCLPDSKDAHKTLTLLNKNSEDIDKKNVSLNGLFDESSSNDLLKTNKSISKKRKLSETQEINPTDNRKDCNRSNCVEFEEESCFSSSKRSKKKKVDSGDVGVKIEEELINSCKKSKKKKLNESVKIEKDNIENISSQIINDKNQKKRKNKNKETSEDLDESVSNSNTLKKKKKISSEDSTPVPTNGVDLKLNNDVDEFLQKIDFGKFSSITGITPTQSKKNSSAIDSFNSSKIKCKEENVEISPNKQNNSIQDMDISTDNLESNPKKKKKNKKALNEVNKLSTEATDISHDMQNKDSIEEMDISSEFHCDKDSLVSKKNKKKKKKNKQINNNEESLVKEQNGASQDKINKSSPSKLKFDKDQLASIFKNVPETNEEKNESSKSSLMDRMKEQLNAARFRTLNEKLYECSGKAAQKLFKYDKEAFDIYHLGYQSQVNKWPVNPLDLIANWLKKKHSSWTVADFGCGQAKLASMVPQKVASLDLVAANEDVIACDMANTPLKSDSKNVVIFCLSLMGTNIRDFISEANRVLMKGGIMKIAEVESRFTDVREFIALICKFGFTCLKNNAENSYFILFEFKKIFNCQKKTLPNITLKSCTYKKR